MSLKFGNVSTVVASTPETVKDVLKTFDLDCCSRPYMTYAARITYNLKDLGFSPYSNYWRELRKLTVTELYTARRVQSFQHVRKEEVASLVEFIKTICFIGEPGSKMRILMMKSFKESWRLRGVLQQQITSRLLAKSSIGSQGYIANVRRFFKTMDAFFDQAIQHHLDDESIKDDIIALLLKMERGELGLGGFKLTRSHTKGILLNILAAGIDTSAQTVTWVMTHLVANPRVMKKVQAEVREVIKNKDNIIEEDIEQLKYLKLVIKETLRINTLVPLLIPREASKDIKIAGYDIPKKTWIHVNVWAIHRNPNVWKDPEAFIPERFMDNEIDYKGLNFELLPFGSGRRMCPGMGMGLALVHLTLINLLYRFDWKLPEGMKAEDVGLEESYGLVCPKKIPLQVIPVLTQWT
ncbi:Cytochrome P450 71B11 [Raphanus sativus]|nr:Cytochrome P450 71B11 [Raphanus sativus]